MLSICELFSSRVRVRIRFTVCLVSHWLWTRICATVVVTVC